MTDSGAQVQYTKPATCSELEDLEFTLMLSLSVIRKKREALNDEEQNITELLAQTREEIADAKK